MFFKTFGIFLAFSFSLMAFEGEEDYISCIQSLSNIHSPSIQDFEKMQAYLQSDRPYLNLIDLFHDFSRRSCRNMKIYDPNKPQEIVTLKSNLPNIKKRVLITYCSLNGPYGDFVKKIRDIVSKHNRTYDCYFMIGSYPSTKEDGMALFHIPYAWKACMFKYIKQLGYEQAIWIDSSMMPIKSLEPLFDIVDKNHRFFIPARGKMLGEFYRPYFTAYKKTFEACGIKPKDLMKMRHFQATVIGLDLKDSISSEYLDRWYELTRNTQASISTLPEELVMTVIGCQMGLEGDILSSNLFTYSMDQTEGCYFCQDTNRK
jgi:hypothetical protein